MEPNGNVRKRPDLWSYISFSRPNSRSSSLASLPHSNGSPDAYGERTPKRTRGYSVDEAYTHQAQWQRNKVIRYTGVAFVIIVLLYFLAPSQYVCACTPPSLFASLTDKQREYQLPLTVVAARPSQTLLLLRLDVLNPTLRQSR